MGGIIHFPSNGSAGQGYIAYPANGSGTIPGIIVLQERKPSSPPWTVALFQQKLS